MVQVNRIVKYEVEGTIYDNVDDAERRVRELQSTQKEVYERFVNGDYRDHIHTIKEPFNVNDEGFWQISSPGSTLITLYNLKGTLENAIKFALLDEKFSASAVLSDVVVYGHITEIEFRSV